MNTRVSFLQRLRPLLLLSAVCGWLSLSNPALADNPSTPVAAAASSEVTTAPAPALQTPHLSPLQMYQQADPLVRGVMLGLALASVLCWTIGLSKGLELLGARRRLRRDLAQLQQAHNLSEANAPHSCMAGRLLHSARDELQLSAQASDKAGIKERLGFRLERLVAQGGRQMGRGTGVLASIGALAPFVGLFGTVWGIMNSFVAIAATHTTNLSVVAPGIAEALLATALGLVAAIPAVFLYNLFARSIGSYKAELADAAAQVLLLASRQLDLPSPAVLHAVPRAQPQ